MSATSSVVGTSGRRLERVLVVMTHLSAAAIVFAVLLRLLSTHARFPWWELDPSRQIVPETALLPSQALMLDIVVWIAAFVGVGACVMLGRPLRWVTGVLVLIGAAGAHTTSIFMGARAGSGPDDAVTASAWSSAMAGAWAMTHLASDAVIRRRVFAVFAGAAWVLATKGAYQVFVEHPAMVAHYKANTEAMLAAQGLEPGGAGAREFERRLMQPEATGWVGMSNAHASILAAMLAMTAALAWSAWGEVRKKMLASGTAGLLTLGALAAAVGLGMTFSKGGVVAGVLALGVTVVTAWWIRRGALAGSDGVRTNGRLWLLRGLAVGLPLLAIAAVCARGAFGESLGERSLLFRWQYLLGASRIIAESMPWGVGPGGFKAAYALHKLALSPETVESPHSVLFDWVACLGVFGVAWCAVLFAWLGGGARAALGWCGFAARGGGSCVKEEHASQSGSMAPGGMAAVEGGRIAELLWLLTPVIACAVAWLREAPTVGPDEWLVRVVAVVAWVATAHAAARVAAGRVVAAAVFGGAVALATHAQIELTPILPATCATVFLLIGMAAAGPPFSRASRVVPRLVALLLLLLPVGATGRLLASVETWESALRRAAEVVAPLAEARMLLAQVRTDSGASKEIAGLLSRQLDGRPVGEDMASISIAFALVSDRVTESAFTLLSEAERARRDRRRAAEVSVRLQIGAAIDCAALGQTEIARREIARAVARIEMAENDRMFPNLDAAFTAAAASAFQAIHSIEPEIEWIREVPGLSQPMLPPPGSTWLSLAAERWRFVIALDPYSLTPVLRLIDVLTEMGNSESRDVVSGLARRALELNQNLRLDPLKKLSEGQRKRLEGLAAGATGVAPAAEPKP